MSMYSTKEDSQRETKKISPDKSNVFITPGTCQSHESSELKRTTAQQALHGSVLFSSRMVGLRRRRKPDGPVRKEWDDEDAWAAGAGKSIDGIKPIVRGRGRGRALMPTPRLVPAQCSGKGTSYVH